MARSKKKKKKHLIGKKEFIFNFVSIVFMIGVGVYFGYRSLYYYSKQNNKYNEEKNTLNGLIINNNKVVQDGDGLHQDTDGYYFKGLVTNNYVKVFNRLFRIIRINNDNTIKLISEDYVASFIWGDTSDYSSSNVHNWLEETEVVNSGVYYKTIPNIKKYLVKTSYQEDSLNEEKIVSSDKKYKDFVSTLTVKDYILANGKNSYLNTGKMFFIIGLDKDNNNLYIEEDGSIQECDVTSGFGIRPVITLKSNMFASGSGSIEDPYNVSIDDKNFINSYVKLGNDMWRVYADNDGVLRLGLNNYLILASGEEYLYNYSEFNSIYDLTDKKSLAYVLNNSYYSYLPYRDLILDTNFNIGEISDDAGYNYGNIYNEVVTCKVGLFNIFDYNPNTNLADYFYINKTSLVGSMAYNRQESGILEESDVRDFKHVVPVISINSSVITAGDGTIDNPYTVG